MSTVSGCVMKRLIAADVSEILHRDLEAEILRCLIPDRLHHRVRDADVPQFDVLISCAQIVGKPVIAPAPAAPPNRAPPAFNTAAP